MCSSATLSISALSPVFACFVALPLGSLTASSGFSGGLSVPSSLVTRSEISICSCGIFPAPSPLAFSSPGALLSFFILRVSGLNVGPLSGFMVVTFVGGRVGFGLSTFFVASCFEGPFLLLGSVGLVDMVSLNAIFSRIKNIDV